MSLNETHDPRLRSWVASANEATTEFPIQNLPFAVFHHSGANAGLHVGIAIGDRMLDLTTAVESGALRVSGAAGETARAAAQAPLNPFMAQGTEAWSALRLALSRALRAGSPEQSRLEPHLRTRAGAQFALPAQIGDYSDFYSSIYHATAVGRLVRPEAPLPPNYQWLPIAYHGRASSLGVSDQPVVRPMGQIASGDQSAPVLAATRRLDFELELGAFIGPGNALGTPIGIQQAESHIFGLCLLNDWSARDIQFWEYRPLGPFLGKNFATTLSPWIVTLEALAPFRVPWTRPAADPAPLPYLDSPGLRAAGAFDIELEVALETAAMRHAGLAPQRLARTSFRHAYWSLAQMVVHHSVNGCNLRSGDVLGTGTQSGPSAAEAGSLLELSVGGKQPLLLPNGERRTFLEDGDAVILRARCERGGAAALGFGECRGQVLPASAAGA